MKKHLSISFSLLLLGILFASFSSCKSAYQQTLGNSPLCLAYPDDQEFIKDQNKLSTIVIPNNYGLIIDSVEIIGANTHRLNKKLRSTNHGNFKSAFIIDLLPGEHKLEVTFHGSSSSMGKLTSYNSKKPIVETFHFEAGKIYNLELKITDIAAKLMSFKKADMSNLGGLALNPIENEKHRQILIDYRNSLSF